MANKKLLIVDDNAALCDSLEDIVRDSGYEPCSAYSYAEGLRLAEEQRPTVAVIDQKLPDGLGTTLLAELKRRDPECICIIATAFADVDSAVSALENGAFHYLHKPVRPVELLRLLERAFELIRLREEKQAAELALRASEERLRHAQKMEALGTLAGGVAHDFNNILMGVLGNAGIMEMKLEPGSPLKKYVDQIILSAENATKLTRNLLSFSRKQIMSVKPTSLNDIIKRMEQLLPKLIGEDIELSIGLGDDLAILADAGLIEQVLMNIATNARGAMPDGGSLAIRTFRTDLDGSFVAGHGYGEAGSYALISLTDTGIGMDQGTMARIFEPFFTTKDIGKGTGLGLTMAYGIVKQHNGYITCCSEPGRGTSFHIYLPLSVEAISDGGLTSNPIPRGGHETILLAEDNPEVRSTIKETLEEFGYRIVTAADGDEAVSRFAEFRESIQLLLLDVIMPRKNGKEAFDEIRRMAPGVKAIFTSGYTGDVLNRRGVMDQQLNFLSKPVAPYTLLRTVRDVLDA